MAARKKTVKKKAKKKAPISAIPKKKRVGKPLFEPTDEQRQNVEAMIGFGLTHHAIASLIHNPRTGKGISTHTLELHFRKELDCGLAKTVTRVANSLVQKALSKDHPQAMTAAIFYLKCQARWRQEEKIVHEIEGGTGVLLAPANFTPEKWIREQRILSETSKAPERNGSGDE